VDEVSFGPRREIRLSARRRRVLTAGAVVVAAAAITAGAVLAVTTAATRAATGPATRAQRGTTQPLVAPLAEGCPPVQPTRPSLAGLPAGMRPGALKVISDAEFSGQCRVSR